MHNFWINVSQPHYFSFFSFKFRLIRGRGEKNKIKFSYIYFCFGSVNQKIKKKTLALIAKQGWMRMGYFQNIHAEKGLEIFFHRNNFRKKKRNLLNGKSFYNVSSTES